LDVAFAGGFLWVGMYGESTVLQVSASTNAVVRRISVTSNVSAIAASAHTVWAVHDLRAADPIVASPNGKVTRINY
jgi:hypothetical protein